MFTHWQYCSAASGIVASDRRLKKNVHDLEGALAKLLALRGVTFEYTDPDALHEHAGEHTGFIAQELERVLPDWVDDAAGYKRVGARGLSFQALTVEALRELSERNDEIHAENDELRERVARLEALVAEVAGAAVR